MKNLIVAVAVLMSTPATFAEFIECSPIAGVDEYAVGIDVDLGIAGFFDNDSLSRLTLIDVSQMGSARNPQTVMTFDGPDASFEGTLRVIFNYTKMRATVTSYDLNGHPNEIGSGPCFPAAPWQWE